MKVLAYRALAISSVSCELDLTHGPTMKAMRITQKTECGKSTPLFNRCTGQIALAVWGSVTGVNE